MRNEQNLNSPQPKQNISPELWMVMLKSGKRYISEAIILQPATYFDPASNQEVASETSYIIVAGILESPYTDQPSMIKSAAVPWEAIEAIEQFENVEGAK